MRRFVVLCVVLGVILPVWASEPGEPLLCSDWVIQVPGLTIADAGFFGAPVWNPVSMNRVAIDNEGRLIIVGSDGNNTDPVACDNALPILARDPGGVYETIGCVGDRDGPLTGSRDRVRPNLVHCYDNANERLSCVRFNQVTGQLLFTYEAFGEGYTAGSGYTNYTRTEYCVINGFPTLNDIAQTFAPVAQMSFYVPLTPEGFQFADYFDTYYGDLVTVGDWSQAQPLQCGYPATAPSVGDYLTVEDPLPTPARGRGYYYVTAVNYQGERRYGRKAVGGVLTGRDPAVLPECGP